MADSFDRFRSFAERYVISRSASFRAGHEEEDGYAATLQARTIYNNIETQSKSAQVCDNRPDPHANQSGTVGSAQQMGVTGPFQNHHPGSTMAVQQHGPGGPTNKAPPRSILTQTWLQRLAARESK